MTKDEQISSLIKQNQELKKEIEILKAILYTELQLFKNFFNFRKFIKMS